MILPRHAAAVPYDCETIVRRLWDYIDGRLALTARDEVEAHIAACERCAPHFSFASDLRRSIGATRPEVTDADEAALRDRVRQTLRSLNPDDESHDGE